ncbi:lactonase family protein [Rhizobium pusense]|nr:beta-propeller fold lactonase family protein [Agrobacterium pusense]MBW9060392.1 lactonase family protein [Agrobacterium pusense]
MVAIEETRPNPSFLTVDRTGRYLYAVHGDSTEMSSFQIGEDGRLHAIGHSTTAGLNPVDVVLDPTGRHLIVTNHLSGSLAVHQLLDHGRLGPLVGYAQITDRLGPHRTEQSSPKPHQAVFKEDGKRLFVPNKGTDTVSVFGFDVATGSLAEHRSHAAQLREGTGPRNCVVHPAMPVLFVVGELDSLVYAIRIRQDGGLDPFQAVPCLPDDLIGLSRASAVVLSPDGARLHVSNRGHDSICTFDIAEDGRLASPRWSECGGRTPRFACYDPNGTGLLVANEDTDTIVCLPSEGFGPATPVARTASPTCIVFRPDYAVGIPAGSGPAEGH